MTKTPNITMTLRSKRRPKRSDLLQKIGSAYVYITDLQIDLQDLLEDRDRLTDEIDHLKANLEALLNDLEAVQKDRRELHHYFVETLGYDWPPNDPNYNPDDDL